MWYKKCMHKTFKLSIIFEITREKSMLTKYFKWSWKTFNLYALSTTTWQQFIKLHDAVYSFTQNKLKLTF
mgnify:CR=1 FL=1